MRPKIVILTLVAAFGVLGLIALLKNGGHSGGDGGQPPVTVANQNSQPATNTQDAQVTLGSSNGVAVTEAMHAAVIQNEINQIQDLQAQVDGTNNPIIIAALIDKLSSNPEAEVRKAALEALKELNDTNAVPGLQRAADNLKDPREKVAILDAIDYISLPSATENVPPELATNISQSTGKSTNSVHFNPAFTKGDKMPQNRPKHPRRAPGPTAGQQPGTPAGQQPAPAAQQ